MIYVIHSRLVGSYQMDYVTLATSDEMLWNCRNAMRHAVIRCGDEHSADWEYIAQPDTADFDALVKRAINPNIAKKDRDRDAGGRMYWEVGEDYDFAFIYDETANGETCRIYILAIDDGRDNPGERDAEAEHTWRNR